MTMCYLHNDTLPIKSAKWWKFFKEPFFQLLEVKDYVKLRPCSVFVSETNYNYRVSVLYLCISSLTIFTQFLHNYHIAAHISFTRNTSGCPRPAQPAAASRKGRRGDWAKTCWKNVQPFVLTIARPKQDQKWLKVLKHLYFRYLISINLSKDQNFSMSEKIVHPRRHLNQEIIFPVMFDKCGTVPAARRIVKHVYKMTK